MSNNTLWDSLTPDQRQKIADRVGARLGEDAPDGPDAAVEIGWFWMLLVPLAVVLGAIGVVVWEVGRVPAALWRRWNRTNVRCGR